MERSHGYFICKGVVRIRSLRQNTLRVSLQECLGTLERFAYLPSNIGLSVDDYVDTRHIQLHKVGEKTGLGSRAWSDSRRSECTTGTRGLQTCKRPSGCAQCVEQNKQNPLNEIHEGAILLNLVPVM